MATATTTTSVDELREALKVKPPSEMVDYVNALIYGEAGAGKTYLIGTADEVPAMRPVLILDVEGGVTTIRHRQGIDVVPVRSMKDIENYYNKLYASIDKGKIHYKTIGIDSVTELADLDMRTVMREAYNKNPDTTDVDVPSPREWGKTRNHVRAIVRAFRDLPCHVIYTAHMGSLQDEGQPTKYFPAFAGKLRAEVPGFMDIVGYLYPEVDPISGVINRRLQVQGTRRVVAKDRTASLGDVVDNPTLPMLWDLISGKTKADNSKEKS